MSDSRIPLGKPDRVLTGRRRGSVALGGLTALSMGAATFGGPAIGLVATFVISDLDTSHAAIGWIMTAIVGAAFALSLAAGEMTDRLGGRAALWLVLFGSGIAFLVLGVAPTYPWLIVGGIVSGAALAIANPATNKLIAEHIHEGHRALITGVKQSGAQAAILVGGLTLPLGAHVVGWRTTLVVVGSVPIAASFGALLLVPRDRPPDRPLETLTAGGAGTDVKWLAALGLLLGFVSAAALFVPLYAVESLSFSVGVAGVAASTIGIAGVAGRFVWASVAERFAAFAPPVALLSVLSAAATLAFLAADEFTFLLWPAALVAGASSRSWTAVASILVMRSAEPESAGRASGIVSAGYFAGIGAAAPVYGNAIDGAMGYDGLWLLATAASAIAFLASIVWWRFAQ